MQAPLTRSSAIDWARRIVADPNAVYLDTETTALKNARICDIAVIAQDGTVLLDTLVKPGCPIPPEATKVHGITDEMVKDAPTWGAIEGALDAVLDLRTVVIYNRGYDEPIIQEHQRSIDSSLFVANWQCAMLAYSDYDGSVGNYGSLKWHKLDAAAAHFGIEPGGHRARADAETTRRVVHAMALAGGPLESPVIEAIAPESDAALFDFKAFPDMEYSLDDLFVLLHAKTAIRDDVEAQIGELRAEILDRMQRDGIQSTSNETTGATARIDHLSRLKVNDKKVFLNWAKTSSVGRLYLVEDVDKSGVADAVRRGLDVPGVEIVTDERLVITVAKGGK
jgi:DNA polymerase III epsilon subunit-like protein